MLNTIILLGRLTKEPELRTTNSGLSVANFDLAIDNPFLDSDGTRGTTFISIRCFGDTAKNVCNHLHKGSKVCVTGSLYQRNFIRKDGSKGSVHEINASSVEFLDPKPQKDEDTEDYDGSFDSAGSLDGEKYVDENGEEKELKVTQSEAKFDPYTGKPLKPAKKK